MSNLKRTRTMHPAVKFETFPQSHNAPSRTSLCRPTLRLYARHVALFRNQKCCAMFEFAAFLNFIFTPAGLLLKLCDQLICLLRHGGTSHRSHIELDIRCRDRLKQRGHSSLRLGPSRKRSTLSVDRNQCLGVCLVHLSAHSGSTVLPRPPAEKMDVHPQHLNFRFKLVARHSFCTICGVCQE